MPLPVASSPAVERFLEKLENVKGGAGEKWTALCPAHDDHRNSLSIKTGLDGRVLVRCHVGCELAVIALAVGMGVSDLFADSPNGTPPGVHPQGYTVERERTKSSSLGKVVAKYDYVDADGQLQYQVWRYDPKDFRPHHQDHSGRWIMGLGDIAPTLYHVPDVIEAVALGKRIYLVEGEKDADALRGYGLCATTASGGAKNWKAYHGETLKGADVVILPDNDDPGRAYAAQAAADIVANGGEVRIVQLPDLQPKGDVSEWLEAGGDFDDLDTLIERTPRWRSDSHQAARKTRFRLDELWDNEAIMRPPPPVVPYLAWASRTTLLAAREKSGKSTLTGYMAARVSVGGEFLGEPCHRGRVLILGLEEYIGDTARRLKEFRADGSMIELVDHFAGPATDRPSEMRAHLEAVDPTLVIIDSLIAYASGLVTDANNATQTQAIVQSIANFSHDSSAAFVIIHHARKADGRYRDSSAIGGAVDIIAEIFTPEETERTDPNRRRVRPIGRVPACSVDFRFTGTAYELVTAGEKGPLDQRILAIVQDSPNTTASNVADLVGDRRTEVLSRITQMIASGVLINDGDARKTRLRRPMFAPSATLL